VASTLRGSLVILFKGGAEENRGSNTSNCARGKTKESCYAKEEKGKRQSGLRKKKEKKEMEKFCAAFSKKKKSESTAEKGVRVPGKKKENPDWSCHIRRAELV